LKNPTLYIHRDITWLAFNYRVLQEAKDENVPLFERIKFLAIYSSNLDEFYRVRVSNHKNLVRAGKKTYKKLEFSPKQILKQILETVREQQIEFSEIFQKQIIPALKDENIQILKRKKINDEQTEFIEALFQDKIQAHVQPVLLRGKKIKPFLQDGSLYLAVYLHDRNPDDKEKYYAIVKIPSLKQGRFISVPASKKGRNDIMIIDDIIRHNIRHIFPGYEIIGSYSIKLTRDAELYIDDEYSGDLVDKIRKSLSKRDVGDASRLVYDRNMPKHFIDYLKDAFELSDLDIMEEGRYHNNKDFFQFPSFDISNLHDIPLTPIAYTPLEEADSIFEAIKSQDHLLYYPYHDYNSVIRFFEDASVDPRVTHIKILQYRVAKVSKIMNALIKAIENGKQVTVFIEIKARFDEKANLKWGERLEAAGVTVLYSFPGLKVHSKMAVVRRVVNGIESFFGYLSSGNFNEETATLYTDFGFFTHDKRLLTEVLQIFAFIETKKSPAKDFEHLGVGGISAFDIKKKLKSLIENEINNAKAGKEAYITLKMNSLQDEDMINMLYRANNEGVKIKLIIRGICSLVPGVEGISEGIYAYSIVDRFLEHARVFIFGNGGEELIYISSADWMVRNLHHRIETMFPIYDKELQYFVRTIIRIQTDDNVKARNLNIDKLNTYKKTKGLAVRSQFDTYYFIKRREENRQLQSAQDFIN